jgi:uncharacterized membrane protein YkvA (DUF1232 family)
LGLFDRLRRVAGLLLDPRTAKLPRAAVALAVVYLLWPLDLVPEAVLPVLGWIDDVTLLWMAFRWLLGSAAETKPTPRPPASGSGPGPDPQR